MRWVLNIRAAVAMLTALSVAVTSLPRPASAGLVSTETVLAASDASDDRERVAAFLEREDVQSQMQALGVDPQEARLRVAALSDEEVRRIAGRIDDAPAGGDALGVVIGAAVLIFVILLITDIAGLTKVFPWTRSVR